MNQDQDDENSRLAGLWMNVCDIVSLPWLRDFHATRSAVLIVIKLTANGSPKLRAMSTSRFLKESNRLWTRIDDHQYARLMDASIAVIVPIHSDGRRACPDLPDPRSAGELHARHHVAYNLRKSVGGGDSVRLDVEDSPHDLSPRVLPTPRPKAAGAMLQAGLQAPRLPTEATTRTPRARRFSVACRIP